MMSQRVEPLLQVEQVERITVTRFRCPVVLSGSVAQVAGRELLGLIQQSGCRRLVVNLRNVQSLSSFLIGQLLLVQQAIEAEGGRLVLCEASPDVAEILELVGLTQQVQLYEEELEALESFSSD